MQCFANEVSWDDGASEGAWSLGCLQFPLLVFYAPWLPPSWAPPTSFFLTLRPYPVISVILRPWQGPGCRCRKVEVGAWNLQCLRARMTLTVPTNTSGIRPVLRPLGAASGHLTTLHPGMSVSHHRSLKTLQGPLSVVEGGVNAPERHGRELTCPDLPPPRHSSGISYRPALMPHINGQPHTCVTC